MRKRHLAATAVFTVSVTALAQIPASAAESPAGTLLHQVITTQQAGWAEPAGSADLTQAAITGLPNGSTQLVAVTPGGTLKHNIRYANGSWQGWNPVSQPGLTVRNASIAGLPNGSSQFVEVTSDDELLHDVRNANGSWQPQGWGDPLGSSDNDIVQASITALPNGSTVILAVDDYGRLVYSLREADGYWAAVGQVIYESVWVDSVSIAGMPNGSCQVVEVTSSGELLHNILTPSEYGVTWQPQGWNAPPDAGSGVVQAAITALPNGSSEIIATLTDHMVGIEVREADGNWPESQWGQVYQRPNYSWASDVSIAGLPNGSVQAIEIGQN